MRDPMDRSRRLTDGTRWRTFMRLLRLDDLMTSYTSARPGAGLLVVDLDLGTHRQRLLCAEALVDRSFYVGLRSPSSSRLQFEMPRADNSPLGDGVLRDTAFWEVKVLTW